MARSLEFCYFARGASHFFAKHKNYKNIFFFFCHLAVNLEAEGEVGEDVGACHGVETGIAHELHGVLLVAVFVDRRGH